MAGIVSICSVTLNRAQLAAECLIPALGAYAGHPHELLTWDNGSTDNVRDVTFPHARFAARWTENIGYAKAVNQLIQRALGNRLCQWICVLDPDIALPQGWLASLVAANDAIPDSGVSGWHCIERFHSAQELNGVTVYPGDVFGVKFFSRKLIEAVGFLCEDYGLYGVEDRDYLFRVSRMGFINYYVGSGSIHRGDDCGAKTPYRQMKWDALYQAAPIMEQNLLKYDELKQYYIAGPALL